MRLSPKKERNKKCEGHTKIQDSKAHSVHKPTVGKKDVCREQEEGESSPPTLFTIKTDQLIQDVLIRICREG